MDPNTEAVTRGFHRGSTGVSPPIMENQMDKSMGNDMETGDIYQPPVPS